MSDREFTGFDAETVAVAVRQPPLGDLRRAARLRRRRRAAGVGSAVALALGGTAVAPFAGHGSGVDWAGPDPTDPPADPRVSHLVVLSERSAVAVEEADNGCRLSFTATTDAGRTWSGWRTNYLDGPCRSDAEGRRTSDVRFTVLDEQRYLVSIDGSQVVSLDAGLTWRSLASVATEVRAFPEKARPARCAESCGAMPRPLAVDSGTWRVYRLTDAPGEVVPQAVDQADDGALWLMSPAPDHGAPASVALSVDRGATWRTSTVPEGVWASSLVAVSAQEAYVLGGTMSADPHGERPAGPARLLHTTDGGRSWADVGTDLPSTDLVRGITRGANGALLVCDVTQDGVTSFVWISRDGGRHFSRSTRTGNEGTSFGTSRGLVWLADREDPTDANSVVVHISADGENWSRLTLPR
ncbi:WD40/YVTN/BNR-like repeat-containing protein [Micromonospora sp. NPDC049460]|uniref:WD40/YVTN/BNR-like repeat-containing protein n=1 Tax=unclassified Micromonospora TaxID=2617518 RepID=UPI00370FE6B6